MTSGFKINYQLKQNTGMCSNSSVERLLFDLSCTNSKQLVMLHEEQDRVHEMHCFGDVTRPNLK